MKVSIRCHRLFRTERIKVTSHRNEFRSEGLAFILVLKRMEVIFLPRENTEKLHCSPNQIGQRAPWTPQGSSTMCLLWSYTSPRPGVAHGCCLLELSWWTEGTFGLTKLNMRSYF